MIDLIEGIDMIDAIDIFILSARDIVVHLHNPVFTNQKKALSLQDKTKRHGSHEGIVEDAVTR